MSTSSTGLQVRGLCKAFGDVQAVDDVSFDVAPGELLAMIGPNGAGKSTTFNVINGQLQADAGRVTFEGQSLLGCTPQQIWQRGIGRTFQMAETFASFTVIENVQMALLAVDGRAMAPWRRATRYRMEDARALLSQVGLASQAGRAAHELAYGDVKRLELAMALAGEPRLLLMDEPTAGMASAERHELMTLTRSLVQQRRLSVLFTEHSMDVVFEHADRVLVLARGQRLALGTPQQVRDDPQVQAVYLGQGRLFEGHRPGHHTIQPATHFVPEQEAIAAPPETQGQSHRAPRSSSSTLLDVQDLCAGYGAARILFYVNLQVQQGEVVALMGRNGAGKSTLLKSLMGLVPQRSGRLRFLSHDLMRLAPHQAAQAGLGYVPEDRRIFTELTVAENLTVGRLSPRQFPDGTSAPHWTPERVRQLFPRLGELWTRPGGRMSGGEQQMLTVARSLMGNPLVLLLDEPSEGVAPVIVEQMAEMILTLKAAGVSILLSEQNLAFASWVADTAVVLEKGHVRQVCPMQVLVQDEATRRQYLSV
jgi:branched-chain amino acid transport system ATP-binding protein